MKLRNKKTGRIVECKNIVFAHYNAFALDWEQYTPNVNSLAELNEEWEDYEPKEPLIEDEKIRKAVRAWAEANNVDLVRIVGVRTLQSEHQGIEIEFNADLFVGWVTAVKTIAELCGEEEE